MKTSSLTRVLGLSWLILLMTVWSCERDNVSLLDKVQVQARAEMTANDNAQILAASHEIMDVTASGLAQQGLSGGRASTYGRVSCSELECAPSVSGSFNIDRTHPDSIIFSGTIIIDYGTGIACKDSTEIRKGKIMDAFVLIKRINERNFNLTETITFEGFQKDTVQLDGIFIAKTSSSLVSSLEIQNAKLTYPDASTVEWSGILTSMVGHDSIALENDDQMEWEKSNGWKKVTGSINGTDRAGADFSAEITKPVLFLFSCSRKIPVSGTIDLMVSGVSSEVDFGTGTCDKTYTITTGATTTEYTFKKKHHHS